MPRRATVAVVLAALAALLTAGPAAATNDPGFPKQWGMAKIGVTEGWKVGQGAGITVAVVDSGVALGHEDLQGVLLPGHDFVDNDDVPQDQEGHGTHVAGIIAANVDNGKGVVGVAPAVKLLPVRVLDKDGNGVLANVVAGIHYAVDHGAQVINLSLGQDTQAVLGPEFSDAIRYAWSKGSIAVVAAGNQFVAGSGFTDEPALVVSATTKDDGKPTYSSQVGSAMWGMAAPGGELPDLGTEGAILSTYWTADKPTDAYAYVAGTSMAAPHVAGAAAVLRGLGLTPQQTVDRLLSTAKDVGAPGHDTIFGAGRLDLAAAVKGLAPTSTTTTSTTAPPPGTTRSTTAATRSEAPTTSTIEGPPRSGSPAPEAPTPVPTPGEAVVLPGQPTAEAPLAAGRQHRHHDDTASKLLVALLAAALAAAVAAAAWRQRARRP